MFFFFLVNIFAQLQLHDDVTFVSGSFNYKIVEGADKVVELTSSTCPNEDTTLEIPITVVYNGNTYKVNSIGEEAFKGCQRYVGDLIVPDQITFIGYKAFANCGFTGSLTFNAQCDIDASLFSLSDKWKGSLTIGDKVPSIGSRAFDSLFMNTENARLTIGSGVKSIGSMAFYNCYFSADETIIIPSNVETVGGQFLSQFKGAKNLDIQATLEQLKQIDMLGLESFETLRIANTQILGENCLYGYTNFKTITIENTTKYMNYAFAYTSFDQDLVIPERVDFIGTGCFSNSKWSGSLTINAKIDEIHPSMFSQATFGGSKLVVNNVPIIGSLAFENCFSSEISVELNNVNTVGSMAFYNCTVGDFLVPRSVNLIGRAAFVGAKGKALTIESDDLKTTNSTWFEGNNEFQSLVLGDNFGTISDSTFANNKNYPEGLTLKAKIKSIGDKAFYNCSGFTGSFVIPETVTYIGENSFSFCSGFTDDLTINANVETIEQTMFSEMSGFKGSLIIGPNVKTIDLRSFEYITCFKERLVIGSNVKTIGYNAFYNTQFKSLEILSPDAQFGKDCFVGMNLLTSLKLYGFDDILINSSFFGDTIQSVTVIVPSKKTVNVLESKVEQINVVGDATVNIQTANPITIQPDESNPNKKSVLTFNQVKSSELKIRSFDDVTINSVSSLPLLFEDSGSVTINSTQPITVSEFISNLESSADIKSSGSEVVVQNLSISGTQSRTITFQGDTKVVDVDVNQEARRSLVNAVISGTINIKVNSYLEVRQCDVQSSSIINLYFKNFQSQTRLKVTNSSNLTSLAENFMPNQVNIHFENLQSSGEITVIEGIDEEKCNNVLTNITLPASNFESFCQDGHLFVKAKYEEKKDKTNFMLYIIIGVVSLIAVVLIVILVVVLVNRKKQLARNQDSNLPTYEKSNLRSTLL